MYTTKIKSIKSIGKIQTYDLNTPKYHNFILDNGILSHNSGKSYTCLRVAELWYRFQFNEDFPVQHICFSIDDVMNLLNSKKLRKGEMIILEEGGVLLNSLDFQNRVSKLFTFVLQSFRSMNIILLINLPVLSMLNKSTRLLLHSHMITSGIDYNTKICKIKPFFHQLNQQSGKIYPKYIRIRHLNSVKKVKRFNYTLPNKYLINEYEKLKFKFVSELNEGFVRELEEKKSKEAIKMSRKTLTDVEQETYELDSKGHNQTEISKIRNVSCEAVRQCLIRIDRKGFPTQKSRKIPKKIN